jgi:GAF domain-containing protein
VAFSYDPESEDRVRREEGPHPDLFGHGTACAGIIRRVAPECRLHSIRVLGVIEVLDRDVERPGAEHDMRLLSLFADQAALAIESSRVFDNLGRAVLDAVAAADPDTPISEALSAAADNAQPRDRDLLDLAALFAELDRQGPEERRLAVGVLESLLAYLRGRGRRPS